MKYCWTFLLALASTVAAGSAVEAQNAPVAQAANDSTTIQALRDSATAIRRELAGFQQATQALAVKAEPLARIAENTSAAATNAVTKNQIQDAKDQLERKRADAVSIADRILLQQAIGAKAIVTTLGAYRTGQTLGLTASPFYSPVFTAKFDKIRQFQWFPALAGAVGAFVSKKPAAKAEWAGAGLLFTASLGDVVQFFGRKADRTPYAQAAQELNKAYANYQETIDLLAFNRQVYQDALRFEARMAEVVQADSTLWTDMEAFRSRPDVKAIRNEVDYRKRVALPGFATFVDSAKNYFDRFERLRAGADGVWQELGATTGAYAKSTLYTQAVKFSTDTSQKISQFAKDTKTQIDKLNASYVSLSKDWHELERTYFLISAAEAQQINGYYLADELIARLTQ